MKKLIAAFCLLLLNLSLSNKPAHAMSWNELNEQIIASETGKPTNPVVILKLTEIISMLVVNAQAQSKKDPHSLLFCPPRNKEFHIDQLISLMRNHVKKNPSAIDTSVQHILLNSMVNEYPCKI